MQGKAKEREGKKGNVYYRAEGNFKQSIHCFQLIKRLLQAAVFLLNHQISVTIGKIVSSFHVVQIDGI